MIRERIAEDVYYFSSDIYVQVCAGAVVTPEGTVLIDTLALPEETREIRSFLETRLESKVRYVVNTHFHADHTSGSCFFPQATLVGHELCRSLLDTVGRTALAAAKAGNPALGGLEVVLPAVTFRQGSATLQLGKRTLRMVPLPGHSPDGIGVLLEEDRILFAGDAVMPIPHVRDGDLDPMRKSLKTISAMGLENIVQGHGEIILRGEIDEMVSSHLTYLDRIEKEVRAALRRGWAKDDLPQISIEQCGKSRILLNGRASELHLQNLAALYDRFQREGSAAPGPMPRAHRGTRGPVERHLQADRAQAMPGRKRAVGGPRNPKPGARGGGHRLASPVGAAARAAARRDSRRKVKPRKK
ncbi:MAG: MBL fold metallo-hydrolase [Anaerolineales bacterium]|jgi:glyoxylase-like metal-dependent hydrolase (beta-lactamase superfamily II)